MMMPTVLPCVCSGPTLSLYNGNRSYSFAFIVLAMSDQQKDLPGSPPRYEEAYRLMATGTLGASLLGLSGLSFAGTVMLLIIATPFLVMTSPILIPAAIMYALITTSFLFSGGCGMGALAAAVWLYRNVGGKPPPGARMRFASKARDMKEGGQEYGRYEHSLAQETTQA